MISEGAPSGAHRLVVDVEAFDLASIIDALSNAGYAILKVGEVPPWMELVSTHFPVGNIYRVHP